MISTPSITIIIPNNNNRSLYSSIFQYSSNSMISHSHIKPVDQVQCHVIHP